MTIEAVRLEEKKEEGRKGGRKVGNKKEVSVVEKMRKIGRFKLDS